MSDEKNTSLDNLFDDADQGICSNGTQGVDIGLTSLNEGLTTLTHGLNRSTFTYETSEKDEKDN